MDETVIRMTMIKVGITNGKPRTGNKEAFLPAFAAIPETNVSAEDIPRHPNSMAMKNRGLS